MKYIILFLFLPFIGFSQGGTWPVKYSDSDPSGAPSASGTRIYFNTATNTLFTWEPAPSAQWRKQPKAFDQVSGCAAPAYTPTARQSTFAVNSCTPKPELYQWTGSAWALLNPETLYTEGTGIDITGGVITNTAPGQTVTMTDGTGIDVTGAYPNFTVTNTSPNIVQTLSIAGQDLTLSGGGGTVAIPAGASLGNGFTAGGGSGTIPDGTVASLNTNSMRFGTTNARNLSNAIGFKKDEENYFLAGTNDDVDGQYTAFFSGKIGDNLTEYQVDGYGLSVTAYDASGNYSYVLVNAGNIAIGNTASNTGAQYAGDYSAGIITNPTSITDVTSVNLLKQTPVSYTNAAAPNNTIFYSTTLSKLAYKDPGGTVNALY